MRNGQENESNQSKEGRTGHEALAGYLTAPLMEFNLAEEIELLHQEEEWLRTGRNSKTLVKQPDFRIVLVALKTGGKLEEHEADARISIQTLNGQMSLHLLDRSIQLPAGCLVALDRGVRHDVEAVEDSSFLLTIAWPKGN